MALARSPAGRLRDRAMQRSRREVRLAHEYVRPLRRAGARSEVRAGDHPGLSGVPGLRHADEVGVSRFWNQKPNTVPATPRNASAPILSSRKPAMKAAAIPSVTRGRTIFSTASTLVTSEPA